MEIVVVMIDVPLLMVVHHTLADLQDVEQEQVELVRSVVELIDCSCEVIVG